MIISIHQPEHLPWAGFFHKMSLVETFVLLDVVQYRKQYFQSRNRIRTHNGSVWLIVPVLTKGKRDQLIQDVMIDWRDKEWPERIWGAIEHSYSRAPFFSTYKDSIKKVYCDTKWERLLDLNVSLINCLKEILGIKTKLLIASDLGVSGKSTELIIEICKKINGTTYVSGPFGKDYLVEDRFAEENISLKYHSFTHPMYKQRYEPFVPEMSVLDLIMCQGDKALSIITDEQKSIND
jgi:hypothetical protein